MVRVSTFSGNFYGELRIRGSTRHGPIGRLPVLVQSRWVWVTLGLLTASAPLFPSPPLLMSRLFLSPL